jgi:superfamily I DNA/RNA helicase
LFLCEPEPRLYITRLRWAGSVVKELEKILGCDLLEQYQTARNFLRLINSIKSAENDGIEYLEDVFTQLMKHLGIDRSSHSGISEPWDSFFEKAYDRLNNADYNIKSDITSLKKMFKRPGGVVVTSCHSIKGEEYETVICFGLLKGYIPNWNLIINNPSVDEDFEAQKLLYVIISRAKKNLHLISEYGRRTRQGDGNLYETNQNIENVCFEYDPLEGIFT